MHSAVARAADIAVRTGNATIVRQVTRLLELMARDLNKLPQRQPDPPHLVES